MTRQRLWVGALSGFLLTVVLLGGLRFLTAEFNEAVASFEPDGVFFVMAGLMLLGVGVAAGTLSGRGGPLTSAVPAAVLLALYAPLMVNLSIPDWYPDSLASFLLTSFSLAVPVVVGVLAATAIWRLLQLNAQTEAIDGERILFSGRSST